MTCGVIWVETFSLGQKTTKLLVSEDKVPLVRVGATLIPKGILPFDKSVLSHFALKAAKIYEEKFGVPDVIHAHSVWPGSIVAQTLSEYWQVPYGVTEHRPSSFEKPHGKNRSRYIQNAVEGASFAITVSAGMSDRFCEYYRYENVHTVALPVRDAFFQAPLHEYTGDVFNFIHISNLDGNKRTKFTIDIFGEYQKRHTNTRLLVVGGSTDRVNELKKFVLEKGYSHCVEFTGQVDRNEIISVINRGDCMILVSALEAGGTVFAEATALGIPSIASATYGGSYMIESDNGIVIDIDDPVALMKAMGRIVRRYEEDADLNEYIRSYAIRRFSERIFVEKHKKIYKFALRRYSK